MARRQPDRPSQILPPLVEEPRTTRLNHFAHFLSYRYSAGRLKAFRNFERHPSRKPTDAPASSALLDPAAADDAVVAVVEHGGLAGRDAVTRARRGAPASAPSCVRASIQAGAAGAWWRICTAQRSAPSRGARVAASGRRRRAAGRGRGARAGRPGPRRSRRRCAARSARAGAAAGNAAALADRERGAFRRGRRCGAPVRVVDDVAAGAGAAVRGDEADVVAVGDEADLLRVGLVGVGQASAPRQRAHVVLRSCRRAGTRRAPAARAARRTGNRTGPCRGRAPAPSASAVRPGLEPRVVAGRQRGRAHGVRERQQRAELQLLVAAHARVRRPAGAVARRRSRRSRPALNAALSSMTWYAMPRQRRGRARVLDVARARSSARRCWPPVPLAS